jgi:ADP-ribosylglycohydrolase
VNLDEIDLRQRVSNSFIGGVVGSAIADPGHRINVGMRYQYLILQACFASGKLPDPVRITDYLLQNMQQVGLSLANSEEILLGMSNESIFPIDKPWDAPVGWIAAFWPNEVKISGRLAAAAVSEALKPHASIQDVIKVSLEACATHGIDGAILCERLEATTKLASGCKSVQEFKPRFNKKFKIPVANSLIEIIPLAFACLIIGGGKPYASIQAVLEMGINSGETASLVGQLAGSLNTTIDFPPEIVDHIIQQNPEIELQKTSHLLGDLAIQEYRKVKSAWKSIIELSEREAPRSVRAHDISDLLFDKLLGYLIGGACGDALGCPVEWMHYEDIKSQWGWVDRFIDFEPQKHTPHRFYEGPTLFTPGMAYDTTTINSLGAWDLSKGTYSDDMRFRLLLCSAILEKEGAVNGSEFADYLLRYRLQDITGEQQGIPSWKGPQRVWAEQLTSRIMLEELFGKRQPVGFCITWDGPIGLIYPGMEELAATHGYLLAACVAHTIRPGATIDSLIDCACDYSALYGDLSHELQQRILAAVELAKNSDSIYQFYRDFYDRFLVPQPSWRIFILEQIPAVFALLALGKNDPKNVILSAVNFGRDTDTIACMVGELAGALYGASALPEEWVKTILMANQKPDLPEIAYRFRDLILKRANSVCGESR